MKTTYEQFKSWLKIPENIDLEFKSASNQFDSKRGSLNDYCAAIANGQGGKLILGIADDKTVIGTRAYQGTYTKLAHKIWEHLKLHIEVEEFFYKNKRILIFHIPKHLSGTRVKSGSKGDKFMYPVRRGESLGEMDDQKTREILNEAQPDFSAEIVSGLRLKDLDSVAIENLKKRWAQKSKRKDFLKFNQEKTLKHLGLLTDQGFNHACLITVGRRETLDQCLPDSEIIYEWRQRKRQIPYDFRKIWRLPFLRAFDEVWDTVNKYNLRIPFQDGLFQREVYGFEEKSIREALLNAITHRDYSLSGRSIFIRACPEEFFIESPGGLLPGITPDNILYKSEWRNRRLAETFEKLGLVERSGQGVDDIFEKTIRDGKGLPDFSRSDEYSVRLNIPAQIKDKDFILYLERIISEKQINLSFEEIYELEKVREQQKVDNIEFQKKFLSLGLVEAIGKNRGTKYVLSHHYYTNIGKSGQHTRIKGLAREQIKQLILNHIAEGKPSRREDLLSGFQEYKPSDISNILQELKKSGQIIFEGSKKRGRWKAAQI